MTKEWIYKKGDFWGIQEDTLSDGSKVYAVVSMFNQTKIDCPSSSVANDVYQVLESNHV